MDVIAIIQNEICENVEFKKNICNKIMRAKEQNHETVVAAYHINLVNNEKNKKTVEVVKDIMRTMQYELNVADKKVEILESKLGDGKLNEDYINDVQEYIKTKSHEPISEINSKLVKRFNTCSKKNNIIVEPYKSIKNGKV